MKNKIPYWFMVGLIIWLIVILLRKKGIFIPVISNHLTDFITVPMYAYLIEYLMNDVLEYQWKPNIKFFLSSVIYLSLLFEVICPMVSEKFTRDILDVAAYLLGGWVCYIKPILFNLFKSNGI
jgi:hypothetical protein